ncbi:MMPL family transporter [Cryptosporangium aurantiacum]|uniref:Putative drug exporter of the RND superfamily n=1 Tax=Cryptosporangium aurantiacum TaxID=134849 RepID=A0A1M7MS08_9ACTN|nr:MMPL family transporter [Cryptosporangium aurantiacum]SHM93852.1 putative drug exporter of the RND superfamily [Cryptosporangium aurantiacum]
MSRFLYRVGGAAAAHPWRTIAAWLVVLVSALTLAGVAGGTMHDNYNIAGTPSQAGTELLRKAFPAVSGADARVVVHGDRVDPAMVTTLAERLADVEHVGTVSPPRVSADGDTVLFSVTYTVPVTDFKGTEGLDALEAAAKPATDAGLQVEYGGQVAENLGSVSGVAEAIGIVAALIILLFAFRSIVAAGLPIAVAIVGLGIGSAAIMLLAAVTDVSGTAPTVASMVGLGVGIDYALLLVTRFGEGVRSGLEPRVAAATATATSGTSIVVAGTTVLLSLFGLAFAGLPVYRSFGSATALVVGTVVLSSVTLVPALCGLAGRRVLPRRERRVDAAPPAAAPGLTGRWAARVGRRPLPWALGALALLLLLATPMLGMRTWPQDAGSQPTSNTSRQAYDLIAAEYGEGANGPLLVAVDLTEFPASELNSLTARLANDPGVATVAPAVISPDRTAAVITVEPKYGPQDERASALVDHLRADVLPDGAEITGLTAVFRDIAALLSDRLWLVVSVVVGLSLVFLLVMFRSVVVPVKAAAMNLLSIAAAYGVVTVVFQWGWGAELLGLPHAVPVSTWVPLLMFAILFGLSMDYEVFLLSRVREDWLRTGDAHNSVVRGLAATGRVITGAALIMVAVFVGFGLDPDVTVKMIGVGMATAIAVDATIVRMVLVPATMALLGRWNWWLPGWLDRVLPKVDLHTEGPEPTTAPEQELVAAR